MYNSAVVAWFVRASVSHSVDSALDRTVDRISLVVFIYMDKFIKFELIIVVPLYLIALDCDLTPCRECQRERG